jgi:hypothetical protein
VHHNPSRGVQAERAFQCELSDLSESQYNRLGARDDPKRWGEVSRSPFQQHKQLYKLHKQNHQYELQKIRGIVLWNSTTVTTIVNGKLENSKISSNSQVVACMVRIRIWEDCPQCQVHWECEVPANFWGCKESEGQKKAYSTAEVKLGVTVVLGCPPCTCP